MCEYKYLGNYHTHTQWCNHGTVSADEAVREAIESGMKVLGFSEHSPFPDDRFHRMKYAELNNYTAYLNELKIRYKNILDIRIGLEIEFFPKDIPYYYKLLNKYGIDYIILGQHYFDFNGKIIKTKLIENTVGLKVRVAEEPELCAVKGSGTALSYMSGRKSKINPITLINS